MTWDARCRRNMECPFFDYDNEYGGGCESGGYCEMPYNVKQISFTKYKNEQKIIKEQNKNDKYCAYLVNTIGAIYERY